MLKTVLKLLGALLALAVVGVAALLVTCSLTWPPRFPETPLPDIRASDDPAVVARGRYLVHAVAHCSACHAPMDAYLASKPGDEVAPIGGREWQMGPLGTIRASNLTPHPTTGIGAYSDAELARAIRHGVKRNGEPALFMYVTGASSDEDLTAIVSYLRSLPPVDNAVAPHEIGLLGRVLFQGPMGFFAAPHDYSAFAPPFVREGDASLERGRYLAEGPASCAGCHSDFTYDGTLAFTGQRLAGNAATPIPDETDPSFEFYAPNLTPDPETGHITAWTKEQFVARMRGGRVYIGSPMPWESYANLTDADVESIWLYLRSLPPTVKRVGDLRRPAD